MAELSGLVDCVDGRAHGEGLVLPLYLQGLVMDKAGSDRRNGKVTGRSSVTKPKSFYCFVLLNFLAVLLEVNEKEG